MEEGGQDLLGVGYNSRSQRVTFQPRNPSRHNADRYVDYDDYAFYLNNGVDYSSDEEENAPDFPSNPEKYNELMKNLALIVEAMRRLGVFERDDSNYGDDDEDEAAGSGEKDDKDPLKGSESDRKPETSARSAMVEIDDFVGGAAALVDEVVVVKEKKKVRFQTNDDYDDDNYYVPERRGSAMNGNFVPVVDQAFRDIFN